MTNQNSIYTPPPFSVDKGGTGNSVGLTNGQLWIGSTGSDPVVNTVTAGTGISVINGAGSITINNTGAAAVTWNNTGTASTINLVKDNGYILGVGANNPMFILPTGAGVTAGDRYIITGGAITFGYNIQTSGPDLFSFKDMLGTNISTASNGASITILSTTTNSTPNIFTVESTNGATFTLS